MDYFKRTMTKTMERKKGRVTTWKNDTTRFRALVADNGEIISTMDCWNIPGQHPLMKATQPGRVSNGYLVGNQESMRRYEIKM